MDDIDEMPVNHGEISVCVDDKLSPSNVTKQNKLVGWKYVIFIVDVVVATNSRNAVKHLREPDNQPQLVSNAYHMHTQ